MNFNVIVYIWIVLISLSCYYADKKINNNLQNQQIYLHEEYYNISKQFYIDNSWNEYLSEVYNEPLSSSLSLSSSLTTVNSIPHKVSIHDHHDIYNKNRIQIYYKNAKIRIKPFNWKIKYLYSTRYGKFDKAPGRYRVGYTTNYIVPSYHWIEVHRFSTHLLYGKDKFEGYSDVSHTTGISFYIRISLYIFTHICIYVCVFYLLICIHINCYVIHILIV